MQDAISGTPSGARIAAAVIWIPMVPTDSLLTARNSARILADRRIRHFYDGDRRAGLMIAGMMGASSIAAWDTYLFYKPGPNWDTALPLPIDWLHQLTDAWADPARHHTGEDLRERIAGLAQRLLAELPA